MARQDRRITLMEVVVFMSLAAIIAALFLPSRGRAVSALEHQARCIATARGVAAGIKAYSASWHGWAHPDPDYYIKLLGHPLKDEDGYLPDIAAQVKDFLCPLDEKPAINSHGYPASYEVFPQVFGQNIMQAGSLPRLLLLRERKELHPMPDTRDNGAVHVFTDLSCKILPHATFTTGK